jgi:hypothetical protein
MTDFLALQIDCCVNWKTHVEYVISKLSSVRCMMRRFTALMKIQNLEVVYFAYLHHCM